VKTKDSEMHHKLNKSRASTAQDYDPTRPLHGMCR
jgi:hypothetical protein